MNWRQFIAALVQTVAWPVTVIIVVVLFRDKVAMLLSDRLSRFKIGPMEAEWSRGIEKAESALAAELRTVGSEIVDGSFEDQGTLIESENSSSDTKDDEVTKDRSAESTTSTNLTSGDAVSNLPPDSVGLIMATISRSRKVLNYAPLDAVITGHKALEEAIRYFEKMVGIDSPFAYRYSVGSLSHRLFQEGYIGTGTMQALSELRKLRNVAVHGGLRSEGIGSVEVGDYLDTLSFTVNTLLHPALIYTARIVKALHALGFSVAREDSMDSGIDLIVTMNDGRQVSLETKYLASGSILSMRHLPQVIRTASKLRAGRLIVVTNVHLSDLLKKINSSQEAQTDFEVMTWTDSSDNDLLARVVARNAE